jgi:hypothetical protein
MRGPMLSRKHGTLETKLVIGNFNRRGGWESLVAMSAKGRAVVLFGGTK